jgi:hypothetical protein
MVRLSDNDAASAIYASVGVDGLNRLAHRAGTRHFTANPVWGGCQVTARDQAASSPHPGESQSPPSPAAAPRWNTGPRPSAA